MAIARQRVASLKTRDPSERGTSVVVFQKGMTADQISGLMKDYKLDLRYVEIKAPAERGQIWTIGLGNFDLAQSYGSVQDQIEGAVNAKRAEFARTSLSLRGSGDFDSAAQWENLANADMFIYRIDAAGAIRDIGRLADNHNVLHLVAVDKEDRKRQAAAIQQIIEMKRVERSESKEER